MLNFTFLRKPQPQKGFTFLEVLVGIMMMTIFVLMASEAIVMATLLRVKAQRVSEAMNEIQEDLEEIKFVASLPTVGSCNPATIQNGYAWNILQAIDRLATNPTAPPVTDTNTVTLVKKDYTLKRILDVNSDKPYNILKVTYQVCENTANCNNPISEFYTEVVADDSLTCN